MTKERIEPTITIPGPSEEHVESAIEQMQLNFIKQGLYESVVRFRDKHNITCAETIYQMDKVMENSPELIEELIEQVGYLDSDDDV